MNAVSKKAEEARERAKVALEELESVKAEKESLETFYEGEVSRL